jgi:hypothetical protein
MSQYVRVVAGFVCDEAAVLVHQSRYCMKKLCNLASKEMKNKQVYG